MAFRFYFFTFFVFFSVFLTALQDTQAYQSIIKNAVYTQFLQADPVPNDTEYENQDALTVINAELAWKYVTDASAILVAVTDGGFEEDHEDLVENTYQTFDATLSADIPADPTSDDIDCDEHGNKVAGILGAVGNNATGVSGVFWSGKMILIRKGSASSCSNIGDAATAEAFSIALAQGAKIINNSYAVSSWDDSTTDISDNVLANNPQVLFVNSAGNYDDNDDTDSTSVTNAAYPNTLFVTGMDEDGERYEGADYGKNSVHLAAPAEDVLSSALVNADGDSLYEKDSGTSFATPLVSGTAALVWSVCPNLTVAQVRQVILDTVTQSSYWQEKTISGGTLNTGKAVLKAIGLCTDLNLTSLEPSAAPGEKFELSVGVNYSGKTLKTSRFKASVFLQKDPIGLIRDNHSSLLPETSTCATEEQCEEIFTKTVSLYLQPGTNQTFNLSPRLPEDRLVGKSYYVQVRLQDADTGDTIQSTQAYLPTAKVSKAKAKKTSKRPLISSNSAPVILVE